MFIKDVVGLFQQSGIPFAIVGGYAVALHGIARGTFDLDIVTELSEANFIKIENALASIGMKPLLPISAKELFRNLEIYISRLLKKGPEAGFGNRTWLQTGHLWPFCERFRNEIAASAACAGVFPEPVREKNLVAWNFRNPNRLRDILDVIVTEDLRKLEVIEAQTDFGKIPVPSIDSLIQMKSRANREQDRKDIAALQALKRGKL